MVAREYSSRRKSHSGGDQTYGGAATQMQQNNKFWNHPGRRHEQHHIGVKVERHQQRQNQWRWEKDSPTSKAFRRSSIFTTVTHDSTFTTAAHDPDLLAKIQLSPPYSLSDRKAEIDFEWRMGFIQERGTRLKLGFVRIAKS